MIVGLAARQGICEPPNCLVSPLDGDVYRVPPGVPAEYSSIPLRVAGATGPLRWYVDGKPYAESRLSLTRGTHVVRVETGNAPALHARIIVE